MDKLAQFANQKYLNLESYRKNGQACGRRSGLSKTMGCFTFTP